VGFVGACGGPASRAGQTADPGGDADAVSAEPADGQSPFVEDSDPAVAALPFVESELIVKYLPGADVQALADAYAQAGGVVAGEFPELQTSVLSFTTPDLVNAASALALDPLIEGIQKNYLFSPERVPNDRDYASQTHLPAIGAPAAWDTTTGSNGIVIAILDTGVDPSHPDLTAKLVAGWNVVDNNGNTADVQGHGTSVAGAAAAASNNATGVAGVSWQSPIMPLRVSLANGQATTSAVASAMLWAINHGARVINCSFAPLQADRTVLTAAQFVRNSGGLVFISAGNDGRTSTATDNANALFIGAVDASDRRASFSTTGPFVDLSAPGTGIHTTLRGNAYGRVSGTSFSSPIAAGVAALVWAVRPPFRPVTVEQILFQTARDLGARGRDSEYGAGRVDAAAAVVAATQTNPASDTTRPTVAITSPSDNSAASGVVRVAVSATDASGIADVVLSLDGQPFATDTLSPYMFAVETRSLVRGTHTLSCVATDAFGNASTPATVRINVGASGPDTVPPQVVINFPVTGTTAVNTIAIQATATDNDRLSRVEWLVDGAVRAMGNLSGTNQVVNYTWDARSAARGSHTITVRITDGGGNRTNASISVVKS